LKNFLTTHMPSSEYKYRMLIDAKDPRFIDVALISKIPFSSVQTHQFGDEGKVFSRDCLEVNYDIEGKPLTVFVNHFKSMFDKSKLSAEEKRKKTGEKRMAQCEAVLNIIKQKFKNSPQKDNWVVLGDLNDYPDDKTSLKKLIESPWMENIVQTRIINPAERWTHFWDTTTVPVDERYKQLDYIFLSKKIADANPTSVPNIIRKGLISKATKYTGPRFTGVTDKQGASDHCPVAVTFTI